MIKVEDIGELAYGGGVTLAEWWDNKRITEGKITNKDVLKKASTYAYLVPGGVATAASAFGFLKGMQPWTDHLSHGFIYDFPRFIKGVVDAMQEPAVAAAGSSAVREAQRILAVKQAAQAQLAAAQVATHRTYQQEFQAVGPFAF